MYCVLLIIMGPFLTTDIQWEGGPGRLCLMSALRPSAYNKVAALRFSPLLLPQDVIPSTHFHRRALIRQDAIYYNSKHTLHPSFLVENQQTEQVIEFCYLKFMIRPYRSTVSLVKTSVALDKRAFRFERDLGCIYMDSELRNVSGKGFIRTTSFMKVSTWRWGKGWRPNLRQKRRRYTEGWEKWV